MLTDTKFLKQFLQIFSSRQAFTKRDKSGSQLRGCGNLY